MILQWSIFFFISRGIVEVRIVLAVEMRNITKYFGSFAANSQIDFLVEKGEIHCLLGENGAGKISRDKSAFGRTGRLQETESGIQGVAGYAASEKRT